MHYSLLQHLLFAIWIIPLIFVVAPLPPPLPFPPPPPPSFSQIVPSCNFDYKLQALVCGGLIMEVEAEEKPGG